MTDSHRDISGADRYRVTGDVHLILADSHGRVLLGRRLNTGFADGSYHLPAGHLEAGESVIGALIREAREEIGVIISPDAAEFVHVMHNSSGGGRVAFFFRVRKWDGVPENREPQKCSELRWASVGALPDNLVGYCRMALTDIADGKPFSLCGW